MTQNGSTIDPGRAPALTEGLRILELVTGAPNGVSFEQIIESIHMSRSSVNRLLRNLTQSSYLSTRSDRRGAYFPGLRLFSLVHRYQQNHDLSDAIHDHLHQIAEKVSCSTQYAVFDRSAVRIVVLGKAEIRGSVNIDGYGVDITKYANRHGIGKIILAFCSPVHKAEILNHIESKRKTDHTLLPGAELDTVLARIREEKYVIDMEESDVNVFRVAVGVFDSRSTVTGAVCCTWNANRFDDGKAQLARRELTAMSKLLSVMPVQSPTAVLQKGAAS